MKKLLFVYTHSFQDCSGGADVARKSHSIFSEQFIVTDYYIYRNPRKISIFFYSLFGYLKSSFFDSKKILKIIRKENIKVIYFDDSVNGKVIKLIKKKNPDIYIVVNFHNNEIQYYYDLYKAKGILYYTLYNAAIKSQKNSTLFSDYRIYITEEDKNNVNPDDFNYSIVPATLPDELNKNLLLNNKGKYYLFFGSAFFANEEAAKDLVEKIAPNVDFDFVIAGKGMDNLFFNYNLPKNVKVCGFVDDLQKLFSEAKAFVCPIYHGSGMKVKLISALMFGKTIVCTDFAAIGYEKDKDCFLIANSDKEFIKILKKENIKTYNQKSRELYLRNYDYKNNNQYYSHIIDLINENA